MMIRLAFLLSLFCALQVKAWISPTGIWQTFQATSAAVVLTTSLMGSPGANMVPAVDRPPIEIPSSMLPTAEYKNNPIVEALLYLADPQVRPDPNDVIVITITSVDDSKPVLAGAKIPVQKARFPVQLRLYSQNILVEPEVWSRTESVMVRAAVCPAASAQLPCSIEEVTMQAQGIAKLVRNLPGMPEGVGVRAAASLPLKPVDTN